MKRYLIIFLGLFLFSVISFAQPKKINGCVWGYCSLVPTDSIPLERLAGVNVLIKGTSIGTITDIDGNFIIEAHNNDILEFFYIGFKHKEIPVNNKSSFTVILECDCLWYEKTMRAGIKTDH